MIVRYKLCKITMKKLECSYGIGLGVKKAGDNMKENKKRLHYAWVICLIAMWFLFCTMGMTNAAFSVYLPFMREYAGISNTECSIILMVRNITGLITMSVVNRYLKRTDVQNGVLIALGFAAVAFIIYALSKSFLIYCVAAMVAGVCYAFGGMIPASVLINRWFATNRTLALGIAAAGTGVATTVLPPVITFVTQTFSLPTAFLLSAATVIFTAVVLFFLLKNNPKDLGLTPYMNKRQMKEEVKQSHTSNATAFSYWCICVSVFMMSFSVYGAVPSLSLLFTGEGIEPSIVALLVSTYGIVLTIGKFVYGWLADTLGVLKTNVTFGLISSAGMFLCTLVGDAHGFYFAVLGVLMFGITNAISTVGIQTCARELSTVESYTTYAKNIQMFYTLGSVLIGPIPGIIADAAGSYVPAYAVFALAMLISTVFTFISLYNRKRQIDNNFVG